MPLLQSDAIILKTYPLAEADRIVCFFSRDHGKLRGVANGARRMKNRFGASLEPLAHSRIQFFEKENRVSCEFNRRTFWILRWPCLATTIAPFVRAGSSNFWTDFFRSTKRTTPCFVLREPQRRLLSAAAQTILQPAISRCGCFGSPEFFQISFRVQYVRIVSESTARGSC